MADTNSHPVPERLSRHSGKTDHGQVQHMESSNHTLAKRLLQHYARAARTRQTRSRGSLLGNGGHQTVFPYFWEPIHFRISGQGPSMASLNTPAPASALGAGLSHAVAPVAGLGWGHWSGYWLHIGPDVLPVPSLPLPWPTVARGSRASQSSSGTKISSSIGGRIGSNGVD